MLPKYFLPLVGTILFILLFSSQALAVEANLPGGTAVSLTIDTPIQQVEFNEEGEAQLHVTGSASIGIGQTKADTTLILVLDASGSTEQSSGLTLTCPDQNPIDVDPGDPVPDENEIIDCEIGAAIALNQEALTLGTIDEVAMVMFAGDAVAADTTPDSQFDPLTAPNADQNNDGQLDVVQILQSIQVAYLFGDASGFAEFNEMPTPDIVKTDYADALQTASEVAALASNENVIIVMVSDGVNNAGLHVDTAVPITHPEKHVAIHTFAIPDAGGFGGTCDSDNDSRGSLQDIVDIQNAANGDQNGGCYLVSDPSDLPALLPGIIAPTLNQLAIQVNGGPERPLSAAELSTPLPVQGPVDIQFDTAVSNLPAGSHEICIRLYAADAGGQGDVIECTTVTIETVEADLSIQQPIDELNAESSPNELTYFWEIHNFGPGKATDVTVVHTLPENVEVIEISPQQGSCSNSDGEINCQLGTLLNGETTILAVHVKANCSQSALFEATVTAAEADPAMENNTAVLQTALAIMDYGDAPEPYGMATHCDFSQEWLGIEVSGETAVVPNEASDDGFLPTESGYPHQRLVVTINTSGSGADRYSESSNERLYLSIWVDYNQDGDWDDEGEQAVLCNVAPGTSGYCNELAVNWRSPDEESLTFQIRFRLRSEVSAETWVRARLSYGQPVGPTGPAEFGEVEDFTAELFNR